jgi:hypothetical protein
MTDKEMRKLSRADLIEMLLEQSKYVQSLENRLRDAENKLSSREIILNESGNIAEAALKLNHIFEDAQAASEQYIQGLKDLFVRQHSGSEEIVKEYESQIKQPDTGKSNASGG